MRTGIRICGEALARMIGNTNGYHAQWKSLHLSSARVTTQQRAKEVVELAIKDEPTRKDIEKYLEQLGRDDTQSDELWNLYFRVYDQFVGYSNGYRSLVAAANHALPPHGLIGDFGSGTGNFSAGILQGSAGRSVLAVDISETGLSLTQSKAAQVTNGTNRLDARKASILDGPVGRETLDGAVMNNVLYTFPRESRPKVLKNIFDSAKPGAIFVLNDPNPYTKKSDANVQDFLTRIATSAVEHGTNGTEFDLAVFAYMNHRCKRCPSIFTASVNVKGAHLLLQSALCR